MPRNIDATFPGCKSTVQRHRLDEHSQIGTIRRASLYVGQFSAGQHDTSTRYRHNNMGCGTTKAWSACLTIVTLQSGKQRSGSLLIQLILGYWTSRYQCYLAGKSLRVCYKPVAQQPHGQRYRYSLQSMAYGTYNPRQITYAGRIHKSVYEH